MGTDLIIILTVVRHYAVFEAKPVPINNFRERAITPAMSNQKDMRGIPRNECSAKKITDFGPRVRHHRQEEDSHR